MSLSLQEISNLLNSRATTWYGQEAVSQLEHALQCAHLAQQAGESKETVVAALLHDLGHILAPERAEASISDSGLPLKDDLHQYVALPFLRSLFTDAVLEPIKLHVEAKRYLCAIDPSYWDSLSPASKHSLELQGGIFNEEQILDFVRELTERQHRRLAEDVSQNAANTLSTTMIGRSSTPPSVLEADKTKAFGVIPETNDLKVVWPQGGELRVTSEINSSALQLAVEENEDWFGVSGMIHIDGHKLPLIDLLRAMKAGRRVT